MPPGITRYRIGPDGGGGGGGGGGRGCFTLNRPNIDTAAGICQRWRAQPSAGPPNSGSAAAPSPLFGERLVPAPPRPGQYSHPPAGGGGGADRRRDCCPGILLSGRLSSHGLSAANP